MGDKVRITVIATGFDSAHTPAEVESNAFFHSAPPRKPEKVTTADYLRRAEPEPKAKEPAEDYSYASGADIDVPTFLRKRRDQQGY